MWMAFLRRTYPFLVHTVCTPKHPYFFCGQGISDSLAFANFAIPYWAVGLEPTVVSIPMRVGGVTYHPLFLTSKDTSILTDRQSVRLLVVFLGETEVALYIPLPSFMHPQSDRAPCAWTKLAMD